LQQDGLMVIFAGGLVLSAALAVWMLTT